MYYNDFQGIRLSGLGFGMMRLPVVNGDDAVVDQEQVDRMVAYAIQNGVNYFDTAWGYHNGYSELAAGQSLARYPRESYHLATKFPGYDLDNMDKVEQIFEEQLRKCGVEYFDFYLIHNVYEKNIDAYLDETAYGIVPYLLRQKEIGRIRHLGFSAHGAYDVMKRFLDAYGDKMEFCQIQLNYLDWHFQDAEAKAALLEEYGLPVWVMEPLRGGRLAKLSDADEAKLKASCPGQTIPAWAFRFLMSVPGVTMVLSGMSDMEQMAANIETFGEKAPLSAAERETIIAVADDMVRGGILPCTACRYCTTHCPQELDIPRLLSLYNEHRFSEGGFLAPMAVDALAENKRPNACLGCRSCESVCPQQLKISEALADFSAMLGL